MQNECKNNSAFSILNSQLIMNWIDLLVLLVIGFGIIKGLYDGFLKQAVALASLVLAIFFAGQVARLFRDMLMSYEAVSNFAYPQIITAGCYILAFIVIFIVLNKLGGILSKVTTIVIPISCLNFLLGGLAGIFFSLFFLSLVFNLTTLLDSGSKIIKEDTKNNSFFFHKVEKLATFVAPLINEKNIHQLQEKIPDLQEKRDN